MNKVQDDSVLCDNIVRPVICEVRHFTRMLTPLA